MLRNVFAALACAVFSLTFAANDAYAVFVTELGTIQVRDPNGQPGQGFPAPTDPLMDIRRIDTSGGVVFTNQFSGAPFAVGGEIRTVSATLLGSAQDGATFTPLVDNRAATLGNDLIFIAAVRGTITSSGATPTATFDSGRGYIISVTPGFFDPRDPDSFAFASRFVEFDLAAPETVLPGQGQALFFDASVVNQSSANVTASSQADGRFLFLEDSTATQNLDPKGGDNWITITTNTLGQPVLDEGFLSQTFQTVLFADLNEGAQPPGDGPALDGLPLTASDLAVLNAIFADMSVAEGLGPLVFATGLGAGPVTNYNPQFATPGVATDTDVPTGDFRAELQTRNALGIQQIIPEPASLTLFGIGMATAGVFACIRRRKICQVSSKNLS